MWVRLLFIFSFLAGHLATLVLPGAKWSFLDIWAAVSVVLVLLHGVLYRQRVRGLLLPAIIAFVAVSVAGSMIRFGSQPDMLRAEMLYILRWFAYASAYVYVVNFQSRDKTWLTTLVWAGTVMAVFGLSQLALYPDLRNLTYIGWDPHYLRVFGTLFDPNFSGILFVLTAILAVSVISNYRKRYIGTAVLMTAAIALILTYSRSSYLALIAGMAVWFVYRKSYKALFVFLAIFFFAVSVLPGEWEGQKLLRSVSSYARLGSAEVALQGFAARPLIGQGFMALRRPDTYQSLPPQRTGSVDTSILYVLAATGIAGTIAYLYLWVRIVQIAIVNGRQNKAGPVFLASIAAVLVHSLFTNSLLYPWVMVWMWILAGQAEQDIQG